jgi:DNA-binding HxlR family transcriptional regulator
MQRTPFEHLPCSIARTLDVVGEWWSLLIVRNVFYGVRRFEPLRASLNISRKVLSQRLETLVRRGILEPRPYQARPPRHEYRLTPMGVDLFPVLMALSRWGDRWLSAGNSPPTLFRHSKCGRVTQARVVCGGCGEELGAHNLRPVLGPGGDEQYVRSIERAAGRHVFQRTP